MDEFIISTLFEGLPRQGPGSQACTKEMFSRLPTLPPHPAILDIGCGTGMQTIDLARLSPDAQITAVDLHEPFLDELQQRALAAGLSGHIRTVKASMDALPFPPASYDLLWAEGSIFIIGVEQGLAAWKKLIRPGGYLAFTEAVWFTDSPSEESRVFWQQNYPAIKTAEEVKAIAAHAGYTCVTDFPLLKSAWWDDYYTPLLARIPLLEEKYRDNENARAIIAVMKQEIEMHRHHSSEYGYQFFLLHNRS
jgi:ubiquinone/menaquinone biosynthesis C-methylase UbiE